MLSESNDTEGRERRWGQVLVACLEALENGPGSDRQGLVARYPEFASELAEFFAQREHVGQAVAPLRTVVQASGTLPRSFGDYELLEELGQGGMGMVYKARQQSLRRLVALKMTRLGGWATATDIQRFRNEAEAAAYLDHPYIVPIYEVGEHDRQPYFSMKLIEGGSLTEAVARGQESGIRVQESGVSKEGCRRAAQLVSTVARAVHHAHQRGILHRDLKPSNILLDKDGQPHVTDFGLSRRVAGAETRPGDASLTQSGQIVGTPGYMAPEQASGKREAITTATDVYGLGAVLYALLAGRPPFRGENVLDTLAQVKERDPEPPSGTNRKIDRDLETICLKCLEKEPHRRYSSAEALAQDLERWLAGEPIEARPASRREQVWRWCRRNPRVASLTGLAVLLVLIVAAGSLVSTFLIWREKEQTQAALAGAQSNADRADGNLRRALDALEKIYLQVDEKEWPEQPQFDRPDRDLLEQMLQFYEQFAQENRADPTVRRETAKAYRRVAKIHEDLRRWPESQQAYGRAITLLRQVSAEQPSRLDVQGELADCSHSLAALLFDRGPQKEGEQAYREAVTLYEKLAQMDGSPDAFRYRGELSECLYHLANHLRHSGRGSEAEPLFRQATALVEKLQEETPRDPEAQRQLGIALQLWAELRAEAHEWPEARSLLERAIGHQRAAVQAKPGQVRYITSLSNHYERMATVLNFLRQPAAAEEALREQVALGTQRVAAFPHVPGYRYQLANTYTVQAMHLHAAGRYPEAEKTYRQALEMNRDLATLYPSKQFCQRHLGLAYHLLGVLIHDMGKTEEAEQLHRQGLIARPQQPSALQDRGDFQIAVGQVIGYVAGQLFNLGERRLAFHYLELATQYQEAALKAKPNHQPYLQALQKPRIDMFWELVLYPDPRFLEPGQVLEFARKDIESGLNSKMGAAWQMYGIACYRLGDWKGAIAKLEKSLELSLTEITKVSAWFFLAMANERLGEHEKARSWYAKAIQVMDHPPPAWSSVDYRRFIYADLRRFRAEAASLLGIKDEPMAKGSGGSATKE